jgi:hypothetical protein
MSKRYIECRESDIPAGVRFDVPRRHQGQIVEVAFGGFDRAEHDHGDPYKRITDRSDRSVNYYKLTEAKP